MGAGGSISLIVTTRIRTRLWRQLTGCVVAYALVLQGVLLGLSGALVAASATMADGTPGIELCLHDVDGAPALPDRHDGKSHCTFCLSAAHQLIAAPSPALRPITRNAGVAAWLSGDWLVPAAAEARSHRPRGPPTMA
jgi:hypothetical protein